MTCIAVGGRPQSKNQRSLRHRPPGHEFQHKSTRKSYSPGTFKPINTQEIHPQLHCTLRMANGGALVQHDAPGLLQLRNDRAGTVPRRLDDLDALVDDSLRVRAVVWRVDGREQCDVHAERVLGHGPALLDLLAQVGGRGEDQCGDDAQAAGVGDRGGELSVADVLEKRLTAVLGMVTP